MTKFLDNYLRKTSWQFTSSQLLSCLASQLPWPSYMPGTTQSPNNPDSDVSFKVDCPAINGQGCRQGWLDWNAAESKMDFDCKNKKGQKWTKDDSFHPHFEKLPMHYGFLMVLNPHIRLRSALWRQATTSESIDTSVLTSNSAGVGIYIDQVCWYAVCLGVWVKSKTGERGSCSAVDLDDSDSRRAKKQ